MLSSANSIETPTSHAPAHLLAQIAKDHEFRERLESDPIAAFAELGVELDASQIPSRVCLPDSLACSEDDNDPDDSFWRNLVQWNGFLG